jgi:3-hydroxypropanoate dehydrogenase
MQVTTEQLFSQARTQNGYLPGPVSEAKLRELYELMKWGPTSANCTPARIIFVQSPRGKEKLLAYVSAGNAEKVRQAPVVAIIGMELKFYELLPRLFHNPEARSWFEGKPAHIETTAMRNSSLQGGYFIVAARALGLDCGPMSGFDNAKMDAAFWAGTTVKTNFICALGTGDASKVMPRHPRLSFEEVCQFA